MEEEPGDLPSSSTVPRPDSPISAPLTSEPVLGVLESSTSNSQAVANTDAGDNISTCSSDPCAAAHTSSSRSSVQMEPNQNEPNEDSGRDGHNNLSSAILEYTHFVKFRDQSYWHCNWIPGNTILFMHPSMVKNYHRKHAEEVGEADAAYEAGQQETGIPSSDGESGSDTEKDDDEEKKKKADATEADNDNKPAAAAVEETPLIGGRLVLP
ncbi:unnamed protein product [Dibothriocephalus latus]|uniref:Uncharacterized protein n=1 Tax=Dibothriocephalus latus TaxID=60516 RepID=A0A3P7LS39_DIBLA|nr:unnamed protein product [Dibothriocephalus latus]